MLQVGTKPAINKNEKRDGTIRYGHGDYDTNLSVHPKVRDEKTKLRNFEKI